MTRAKLVLFILITFLISSSFLSATISTSTNKSDTSTKKLVLIGDSITKSSLGPLYVNNLSTMPYWNDLSVVNSGIPACSVRLYYDHQYMVTQRISQYNPDYVLVFLGIADASSYRDVVRFEKEYRWLIETILRQCNGSQLLLVKFSWTSLVSSSDLVTHADVIEKIAREYQLPFSDVYEHTKWHEEWFIDGVHPNNIGSYQIASCINDSFADYINGTLHSPLYIPSTTDHSSFSTTENSSFSENQSNSSGFLWITGILTIAFLRKTRNQSMK